jgi:thymidylate synthase (FAD)
MTDTRTALIESLKGQRFPVLDKGYVALNDVMGSDRTIVDRARGTTGTESRDADADRDLLRFMMRHNHGSSFEFPEIDVQVCTTFVVWRQMIRHRAGNILDEMSMWDEPSVNELSGRYSKLPEMVQATEPEKWRRQSKQNRQGSGPAFDPRDGEDFSKWESEATDKAMDVYCGLINNGVAKEQARKVYPMGGYTIGAMKMDLRNWLHWLTLRLAPDAQEEIRDYAKVIAERIVGPLFPETYSAFEDYTLGAVTLTRLDVEVISGIKAGIDPVNAIQHHIANKREREECWSKLVRIGLAKEDQR